MNSTAELLDSDFFHFEVDADRRLLPRVECLMRAAYSGHTVSSAGGDLVIEAVQYHLNSGGRRTRAALGVVAAKALGLDDDDAIALAAVPELLHNASLIHDDIQDQGQHRRGRNATWFEFGTDIALCAGDLLISAAYGTLAQYSVFTQIGALVRHTHERTARVIRGQGRDLQLADALLDDFDTYESVAAAKSGPLLALGTELALLAAGYEYLVPSASEAAANFAIAYQIADDIEDQERDVGCFGSDRCLNAVDVFRVSGESDPVGAARGRALAALLRARTYARRLPGGVGAPLLSRIGQLRAELSGSSA